MAWWEKTDGEYLYASDWNTHINEIFTKIEDKRKLYFGKIDNDFAQYFGGIIAFPSSATVYEANEHGVITLKPFAKVQGKDGELALYSPIPSGHVTMPNNKELTPSGWMGFFGDDYVTRADDPNFNPTGAFTIEVRFKLLEVPAKDTTLIMKGNGSSYTSTQYMLYIDVDTSTTYLRFYISDGTQWIANVPVTMEVNKEYVVVAEYDGVGTAYLYLYDADGNLISSNSGNLANTSILNGTYDFRVCYRWSASINVYPVAIVYYVRFYNGKALSNSEIAQNIERPDNPITDNLVLWWHWDSIDEVNGLWTDKSGNGLDGTIVGAVGCVPAPLTYIEDAYRLQAGVLDAQYERKEWWFKVGEDILPGKYKLVFRVKDSNVADDIQVTVTDVETGTVIYQNTFTTGVADTWVDIETDPIDFSGLSGKYVEVRIEKATTTANTIYIDYVTLDPYGWTPEIYYVVPDSDRHIGEMKVWDTMGTTDETQWVRVFNKEHKYVGDCVIEDGFRRWWITKTTYGFKVYMWDGTTWRIVSDIRFSTVVDFKITEISSTNVKGLVTLSYAGETWESEFEFANNKLPNNGAYGWYERDAKFIAQLGSPFSIIHYDISDGALSAPAFAWFNNDVSGLRVSFDTTLRGGFKSANINTYIEKCRYRLATPFDTTNLFKEAENATLSVAPDPLTYTDDFSTDTSARYMLDTSLFTWDTVNGIVTTTTAPAKTVLRSLKFSYGDYYLDVAPSAGGVSGLLLYWQPTENSGYKVVLDETNQLCKLIRVDNGTETELSSAATTVTADAMHTIHVNVDSAGNFTVDVNGTTVISGVADVTYISGYVGMVNDAGSTSFDNLQVTAHEVIGRGAQVNRFIDDFDWDSSAEYSGDASTDQTLGFAWDTINGVVKTQAENIQITLNSLKFGTGTYKFRLNPKSLNALGHQRIMFLFAKQEQTNGLVYNLGNNHYHILFNIDESKLEIHRIDDGTKVFLVSNSYTFSLDTWYDIEVKWDTSTGSIDVYINGTLVVNTTDTTYTGGYIGFATGYNGEVWFDDLEVQAEEVTSSGNTCVILGGVNHGGFKAYDINAHINITPNVTVPLGRYLCVCRVKSTADVNNILTWLKNLTDSSRIDLDSKGYSYFVTLTNRDYTYIIRPIELGSDDNRDNIQIEFGNIVNNWTSKIVSVIDYFLLIPISGLESQTLMPQDIAVRSMVYTEYVDDAVAKAFDVRDEVVYVKKPVEDITAYKATITTGIADDLTVDHITIKRVAGDYGGNFATFDPSVVITNPREGDMFIAHDTNATAPEVRLYVYSGGAWKYVTFT